MKIAILSVSEKGKKLSSRLKELLDEDPTIIKTNTFHKNVKDNIDAIFNNSNNSAVFNHSDNNTDKYSKNNPNNPNNYDAIIGIMATGILIRSIAGKIQDKTIDPAIISMDDNGKYVISLVSGHIGGANELTKKIAKIINSEPVITTATDINDKLGIDTLATKLFWEILNKNEILAFNKAILEEKPVKIYINVLKNENINYKEYIEKYIKNQEKNTLEVIDLKNTNMSIETIQNEIFSPIPDRSNDKNNNQKTYYNNYRDADIVASFNNHRIFFKPKKIVLGVGTRANISKEKVINGIQRAMENLDLPIERIDSIATVEIKQDEKGILEAVNEIDKPLSIVSIDEIKEFESSEISNSEFVQKKFDIPGVAEPVALIISKKGNKNSKLIQKKIAMDGVTIAVAVSDK